MRDVCQWCPILHTYVVLRTVEVGFHVAHVTAAPRTQILAALEEVVEGVRLNDLLASSQQVMAVQVQMELQLEQHITLHSEFRRHVENYCLGCDILR